MACLTTARDRQTPAIDQERLYSYLRSHLINLRRDDFGVFMADRQKRLLALIERATGKAAYSGDMAEEGVDVDGETSMYEA